jgi:hypothetical protein
MPISDIEFTFGTQLYHMALYPLEEAYGTSGWTCEGDGTSPLCGVLVRDVAKLLSLTTGAILRILREANCARQRTTEPLKFSSRRQKQTGMSRSSVARLSMAILDRSTNRTLNSWRSKILHELELALPLDEPPVAAVREAEPTDEPAVATGALEDVLPRILEPLFARHVRELSDKFEQEALAKMERILRVHSYTSTEQLLDVVARLNHETHSGAYELHIVKGVPLVISKYHDVEPADLEDGMRDMRRHFSDQVIVLFGLINADEVRILAQSYQFDTRTLLDALTYAAVSRQEPPRPGERSSLTPEEVTAMLRMAPSVVGELLSKGEPTQPPPE